MLKLSDKLIQLRCRVEHNLHQHRIVAGHAVALDHIRTVGDVRIEFLFPHRLNLQIDECLDPIVENLRVHTRAVAGDHPVLFQAVDSRRNRRRSETYLVCNTFERKPCIFLQQFHNFPVCCIQFTFHSLSLRSSCSPFSFGGSFFTTVFSTRCSLTRMTLIQRSSVSSSNWLPSSGTAPSSPKM